MGESSTDEKIARLVHSVLEAVDLRMAEVRREVQTVAEDLERRNGELQVQVNTLLRRVEQLSAVPAATATPASPPAPAAAAAPIAEQEPTPAVVPALPSLSPRPPSFSQVSAPLLPTATPVVTPVVAAEPVSLGDEQIDVDRLTDLLTARLGRLNLPRAEQ